MLEPIGGDCKHERHENCASHGRETDREGSTKMNAVNAPDRVRANTAPDINLRIDRQIEENVRHYSGRPAGEIMNRIEELEREWDIERFLEAMASSFSLTGLALGATKSRIWFVLPTVVLSFLLLHAIQGWCPPVPVLRRMGVRTRQEIERERYALKALMGDFTAVDSGPDRASNALTAVAPSAS